jgi:hypothetical protein
MEFKNSREVEVFYMGQLERARDEQEQEALQQREAAAFNTFFARNQKVARNQANEQLFRTWLDGIEATVASLEEVLAIMDTKEHPPYAEWTAYHEHQSRQKLIQAICSEDPRIFAQSENGQRVEQQRLQFFETVDLQQRLENIRNEKRLRAMTIPALREERAASKPVQPKVVLDSKYSSGVLRAMSAGSLRLLISSLDAKGGEGTGMRLLNERLQGIN